MDDHDAATAEAARAQAEARRKKILDKANKRMGVVSGEEALAEADKKESEAKAARIRAARQRRYGKKSTETPAASKDEPQSELNDQPAEAPAAEEAKETPANIADNDPEKEPEQPADEPKEIEAASDPTEEPKKKYVGVARMRRNMIKKKKEQEDSSDPVDGSPSAPFATEISVDSKKLDPLKLVTTVPIYMHILTVLLLFFAGMDVSIQQYHHQLEVHSRLAVAHHGIPLVHRSLGPPPSSTEASKDMFHQDPNMFLHDLEPETLGAGDIEDLDEFEEETQKTIPIIDPIFGVDLDELTKGPGLVNQLARGAVAAHRSIIWLVYFWPLSILQSLVSIPQALLRSPPALCIIALVLRHLVGKTILGARIPEPPTGGEKGGAIDLIAMAKTFVTSFFNSNFPTAVALYEAFTHLRSDMYVILCGVFSGLVYVHLVTSDISEPQDASRIEVNDEL